MDLPYADEVDLLDSLVEFHPEWIATLPEDDVSAVDDYYGFRSQPADLAAWRVAHMARDRHLQGRAQAVLQSFPGSSLS